MELRWEDAGNGEPRDQNADSRLGAHSFWSLGPTHDDRWGVELIARDDDLNEIWWDGVHLGSFAAEADAKRAAQEFETAPRW